MAHDGPSGCVAHRSMLRWRWADAQAGQPGVVRSGSLSVFELDEGDCLADPSEAAIPSEVDELDAVPCSKPHRLEVFAVVAVETGDDLYPERAP